MVFECQTGGLCCHSWAVEMRHKYELQMGYHHPPSHSYRMLNKWMALNRCHTRLEILVDEDRLYKTLPNIPCFHFQVVSTYPNIKRCIRVIFLRLEMFLRTRVKNIVIPVVPRGYPRFEVVSVPFLLDFQRGTFGRCKEAQMSV